MIEERKQKIGKVNIVPTEQQTTPSKYCMYSVNMENNAQ